MATVLRKIWIMQQRRRLKNCDFSIVSSNNIGGMLCSDLKVSFNSPFVNLYIRANDYIKMCSDLRGYMDEELKFTREIDPYYGLITFPTAYLRDVKIYFMHYKDEKEALDTWKRRKERITYGLYLQMNMAAHRVI